MTIFRSNAGLTTLVAALLAGVPASAAARTAGWRFIYSDSENLQKLVYGEEETEGDVYFRCTPASGWIFFIHDYDRKPGKTPRLTIGSVSVTPLARVDYDSVISDSYYVDAAIPANHPVLRELAQGKTLHFVGQAYPVSNWAERRQIERFLSLCDERGERG